MIPSCPERGQRVQRNPNLNSAESSLLTFFQESLKRFLANIARKSKKDKKDKKDKKAKKAKKD